MNGKFMDQFVMRVNRHFCMFFSSFLHVFFIIVAVCSRIQNNSKHLSHSYPNLISNTQYQSTQIHTLTRTPTITIPTQPHQQHLHIFNNHTPASSGRSSSLLRLGTQLLSSRHKMILRSGFFGGTTLLGTSLIHTLSLVMLLDSTSKVTFDATILGVYGLSRQHESSGSNDMVEIVDKIDIASRFKKKKAQKKTPLVDQLAMLLWKGSVRDFFSGDLLGRFGGVCTCFLFWALF